MHIMCRIEISVNSGLEKPRVSWSGKHALMCFSHKVTVLGKMLSDWNLPLIK